MNGLHSSTELWPFPYAGMASLQELTLAGCEQLTAVGLRSLGGLTRMRCLSLQTCHQIRCGVRPSATWLLRCGVRGVEEWSAGLLWARRLWSFSFVQLGSCNASRRFTCRPPARGKKDQQAVNGNVLFPCPAAAWRSCTACSSWRCLTSAGAGPWAMQTLRRWAACRACAS